MFYRVEIHTVPDEINGIGYDVEGWHGVFRPGGFYKELLVTGAHNREAWNRLKKYLRQELPWPHLPPTDKGFNHQFWFTPHGYKKFEEVAELFLLALGYMPEAKDVRVLVRDIADEEKIYEDEYQVAVAA